MSDTPDTGWVIVPRVPTDAMREAAVESDLPFSKPCWGTCLAVFGALVHTAPNPLEDEALVERVAFIRHKQDYKSAEFAQRVWDDTFTESIRDEFRAKAKEIISAITGATK